MTREEAELIVDNYRMIPLTIVAAGVWGAVAINPGPTLLRVAAALGFALAYAVRAVARSGRRRKARSIRSAPENVAEHPGRRIAPRHTTD